jgi:two-component system OmpR family sensor kinase
MHGRRSPGEAGSWIRRAAPPIDMTLRLRLVLALLALTTVGLCVFGFATYSIYSRSQYERLDDQLRTTIGFTEDRLRRQAGPDNGFGPVGGLPNGVVAPDPRRVNPDRLPAIAFAELIGADGDVINSFKLSSASSIPVLPEPPNVGRRGRFLDVDSEAGDTRWRVYLRPSEENADELIVVASPLSDIDAALSRLVWIEVSVGIVLLAVIGVGSWFILRRGLRPLERMAVSAGSIADGNLSERVVPSGGPTEVGQLGFALNTMLDEIEDAFRERDATEHRLRQFLADASHELRTPLTSIQGFAELFHMGAEDDRVQLEVIFRRIEEESARMKGLVEDLLLLARLDETRPAARDPVDLAVLAADACSDAVATAPERPITLDAPAPVVVAGDRDHLRQALANLMTNAIRHTPDGTPLIVRISRDDSWAEMAVTDQGPGLDTDALAHAFDRFWQADRARVGTGSGLGLAIVAGIAEEHGGSVAVENLGPDGEPTGARFTLRLPLQSERATR